MNYIKELSKVAERQKNNLIEDMGVNENDALDMALDNVLDERYLICKDIPENTDRLKLRNKIKARMGNTKIRPMLNDVKEIVKEFHPKANISKNNGKVSIQLHSDKGKQGIILELTNQNYSFEIDQDFEIASMIIVKSQVNPEI